MSVTYNEGIAQARVFLRGQVTRLKPADWIAVAEQSRQHFSRDRPRERIQDITGDGTSLYTLTGTVTGWTNEFSQIKTIEYPADEQDPIMLQRDKFKLYLPDETDEKLKFLRTSPGSNETIRMTFTAPHLFDGTGSSIANEDKMLLGLLMAYYAAQAAVSDYLQANRSNLPNDSVDFSQKADDMQDLADKLLQRYAEMLKGSTEGAKHYVTKLKDYDMLTGFGEPYIIHNEDDR